MKEISLPDANLADCKKGLSLTLQMCGSFFSVTSFMCLKLFANVEEYHVDKPNVFYVFNDIAK